MYLVIRGDRLYEGYSIVYTTKSGKKSTRAALEKPWEVSQSYLLRILWL